MWAEDHHDVNVVAVVVFTPNPRGPVPGLLLRAGYATRRS